MTWYNILHHIIFRDMAKYSLTTLEYLSMSHPWFVTIICLFLFIYIYIYIYIYNVEIGGHCILEKYLVKFNVSKYIKYLTNMC